MTDGAARAGSRWQARKQIMTQWASNLISANLQMETTYCRRRFVYSVESTKFLLMFLVRSKVRWNQQISAKPRTSRLSRLIDTLMAIDIITPGLDPGQIGHCGLPCAPRFVTFLCVYSAYYWYLFSYDIISLSLQLSMGDIFFTELHFTIYIWDCLSLWLLRAA